MTKKKDTSQFIADARKVHGDKYDYSKVEYVNSTHKVCITCPKHGDYLQAPITHLANHGCPECAKEDIKSLNLQRTKLRCYNIAKQYKSVSAFRKGNYCTYLTAVRNKWIEQYDWLTDDVIKVHKRHLYTQDEIIKRLKDEYGDKCDYSLVHYINMKTPVSIRCLVKDEDGNEHGIFTINLTNVFTSHQGCPKCGMLRRKATQTSSREDFIKKAKEVHGEKYDYYKVKYTNNRIKVCIICSVHGEFWQSPSNHLSGKGCPICANNFKKWDKLSCEKEARKYEFAFDFRTKSTGAYNVARENGWISEYTWLKQTPIKEIDYTNDKKYIYVYEFQELNSAYVGLTNSLIRRNKEHRSGKDSSVFDFAQANNCQIPEPKILESGILMSESGAREHYWEEQYRQNGWVMINKAQTGAISSSLGAIYPIKWTKKAIREAAKECGYDTVVFQKRYTGAYEAIINRYRELLNELFPSRSKHVHHTVEDAMLAIKNGEITTRAELRNACMWAYTLLLRKHMLDDVFGKPKEYTREEALQEADNYTSICQIRKENYKLWKYLKDNNLFKVAKPTDAMFRRPKTVEGAWEISQYYNSIADLTNHASVAYRILRDNDLLQKRYPESRKFSKDFWNEERCKEEARKYTKKTGFKKGSPVAYKYAKENGWLDQYKWFTVNKGQQQKKEEGIKKPIKQRYNWTYEHCYEEARKYNKLYDFIKQASAAYNKSRSMGWLKDYTWLQKRAWSYEECKEEAKKYDSRNSFKTGAVGAYRKSVAQGWIVEFFPHKRQKIKK